MREMESRYEEITTYAALATLLGVDVAENQAEQLQEHSQIYWLHYQAANIATANGDLKGYETHLLTSRGEMEAIEGILNRIAGDLAPDPGDRPDSGGFETPANVL